MGNKNTSQRRKSSKLERKNSGILSPRPSISIWSFSLRRSRGSIKHPKDKSNDTLQDSVESSSVNGLLKTCDEFEYIPSFNRSCPEVKTAEFGPSVRVSPVVTTIPRTTVSRTSSFGSNRKQPRTLAHREIHKVLLGRCRSLRREREDRSQFELALRTGGVACADHYLEPKDCVPEQLVASSDPQIFLSNPPPGTKFPVIVTSLSNTLPNREIHPAAQQNLQPLSLSSTLPSSEQPPSPQQSLQPLSLSNNLLNRERPPSPQQSSQPLSKFDHLGTENDMAKNSPPKSYFPYFDKISRQNVASNPGFSSVGLGRNGSITSMSSKQKFNQNQINAFSGDQTNPHHEQVQRRGSLNTRVGIPKQRNKSSPLSSPVGSLQKSFDELPNYPRELENSEQYENKFFVTITDYSKSGHLDVKRHEKIELLTQTSPDWWFVRSCVTGSKGTLPSHILVSAEGVNTEEWYFGLLSRQASEEILERAKKHGTFLVRQSESKPGGVALSVLDGDLVKHYRIQQRETGGYFISKEHQFPNLQELIESYSKAADGLCSRLVIPCSKHVPGNTLPKDQWELDRSSLIIGDVLGSGQFGVVREGLFQNNIKVAIKELKKDTRDFTDFHTEVMVLKNLRHNHLLTLLGVCTDREPYYIVTEFMKNGSLLVYLQGPNGRYLRLEELLHIALQVADGMTYLEAHKYIHRDLAARNVLLDDRLNSKIADFGMSRLVTGEFTTCFSDRVPVKWTALEALLHGQFSTKSDVWSFGILLAEIVTRGITPYSDLDNHELVPWLSAGNRMHQNNKYMEDDCYNIMLECWAKTPENRPSFFTLQIKLTNYIRDVKRRFNQNAFGSECQD